MAAHFLPDPADLWEGADVPDVDEQAALLDEADLAANYPDADDHVVAALLDDEAPWWRIDDDQHAEWVMAQVGPIDVGIAQIEAQEREYVTRVRHWSDRMRYPLTRRRLWAVAQLTAWALRRRAASRGAVKTIKVPSGEVRTRKAREPWPAIVDQDAVVAWAKLHHPDIVKVVESVSVTDLGKVARVGTLTVPHPDTGEAREVEAVIFDGPDGPAAVPGAIVHTSNPTVSVVPYEVS